MRVPRNVSPESANGPPVVISVVPLRHSSTSAGERTPRSLAALKKDRRRATVQSRVWGATRCVRAVPSARSVHGGLGACSQTLLRQVVKEFRIEAGDARPELEHLTLPKEKRRGRDADGLSDRHVLRIGDGLAEDGSGEALFRDESTFNQIQRGLSNRLLHPEAV